MYRARLAMTIPGGGAGLCTLYFLQDAAPLSAVVTAMNDLAASMVANMPSGSSIQVPSSGDAMDEATGTLTGTWSASGGALKVSSQSSAQSFAAGTGYLIQWKAQGIVRGRRIQGRTFVCPVVTNTYDPQGTIQQTLLANAQTAATAFAASGFFGIWHRPSPAGAGSISQIQSAVVPDRVTSLRSRRS